MASQLLSLDRSSAAQVVARKSCICSTFGGKSAAIAGSVFSRPSPFQGFLALFGQKSPKRTGMTSLGFPGLSSQSVSGFFGPFRPENSETDWDDKPGLPRVVIPVRFKVFWPFSARKPRNGLGWASQGCHPCAFLGFWPLSARKTRNGLG